MYATEVAVVCGCGGIHEEQWENQARWILDNSFHQMLTSDLGRLFYMVQYAINQHQVMGLDILSFVT